MIRHEKYSRSADVYSFAMILFELLTHEVRVRVRVRVRVSLTLTLTLILTLTLT